MMEYHKYRVSLYCLWKIDAPEGGNFDFRLFGYNEIFMCVFFCEAVHACDLLCHLPCPCPHCLQPSPPIAINLSHERRLCTYITPTISCAHGTTFYLNGAQDWWWVHPLIILSFCNYSMSVVTVISYIFRLLQEGSAGNTHQLVN